MSVQKETTYGYSGTNKRLKYRYAISGINYLENQTGNVLLEQIESIMNNAFYKAEIEIEKELYKRGLMTCNAYLESIEDMRVNGNYLVQEYIKELDKKYKES